MCLCTRVWVYWVAAAITILPSNQVVRNSRMTSLAIPSPPHQRSHGQYACPPSCLCSTGNSSSVEVVDCRHQGLTDLPHNLPPSVKTLYLSWNKIALLDLTVLEKLHNLEAFILSWNNVKNVSSVISVVSSVKSLYLDGNKLQGTLGNGTFSRFSELTYLNLSSNKLSEISHMSFQNITKLDILDLSNNVITTIHNNSFDTLFLLRILNLSNNQLEYLKHEWFQNLINLSILSLRGNKVGALQNVVFWSLKNLVSLDLSRNNISFIGLLSLKGLNSIKQLNFSLNQMATIQEGTLRPAKYLQELDLSHNPLTSLDLIFKYSSSLQKLYLNHLNRIQRLTHLTFKGLEQLRKLVISHCNKLESVDLNTFQWTSNLRRLDLRYNNLNSLPAGLFQPLGHLEFVYLNGNPWFCDCRFYWILLWFGDHTYAHLQYPSETTCDKPLDLKGHVLLDALDKGMICINASISNYSIYAHFRLGSSALLQCQSNGSPMPSITWVTPHRHLFHWVQELGNTSEPVEQDKWIPIKDHPVSHKENLEPLGEDSDRFLLLQNGNLFIKGVQRGDSGFYRCIASNVLSNQSVTIHLTLDYDFLINVKIVSILVGLATSFGFLLLTLIGVCIQIILRRCGVSCPCDVGGASPRAQQLRRMLESMEGYKSQQLERLRENYTFQVQRIKENCIQQMEKLRESYSGQCERLRDIRDYGTSKIDCIRDNYYQQVQRIRDYGTSQIDRLRENYIFQRNRIRKFSAHQLYRLRENYKLQQQHLNKILENLNLESCRNVCARTDSIIFDSDIVLAPVLIPPALDMIPIPPLPLLLDQSDNSSQISAYYTPDNLSEISPDEVVLKPEFIEKEPQDIDLGNPDFCPDDAMLYLPFPKYEIQDDNMMNPTEDQTEQDPLMVVGIPKIKSAQETTV